MKIHKILFPADKKSPLPGTFMHESHFLVKPEWEVWEAEHGVFIRVAGKGVWLYPWSNIMRVEYVDESLESSVSPEMAQHILEKRKPGRPRRDA